MMSGESRVDLLNWVNSLLDLNYTKVEQLGSGAAYCQIIDSIYLDVPMGKVKFDATKEYEYLNNYKVLQSACQKHKISKSIPVDRLVKCKFQDNLEFFQWIRKFWKENKDESKYDPNSRRKFIPAPASTPSSTMASRNLLSTTQSSRRTTSASSVNTISSRSKASNHTPIPSSNPSSRISSLSNPVNKQLENDLVQTKAQLEDVSAELEEYKVALDTLETERNFYFNKLREIEILTETTNDLLKDESQEHPSLKDILIKVQEILYNTEEGFQVPDDIEADINIEEETF